MFWKISLKAASGRMVPAAPYGKQLNLKVCLVKIAGLCEKIEVVVGIEELGVPIWTDFDCVMVGALIGQISRKEARVIRIIGMIGRSKRPCCESAETQSCEYGRCYDARLLDKPPKRRLLVPLLVAILTNICMSQNAFI
jgi:hypothetical protein